MSKQSPGAVASLSPSPSACTPALQVTARFLGLSHVTRSASPLVSPANGSRLPSAAPCELQDVEPPLSHRSASPRASDAPTACLAPNPLSAAPSSRAPSIASASFPVHPFASPSGSDPAYSSPSPRAAERSQSLRFPSSLMPDSGGSPVQVRALLRAVREDATTFFGLHAGPLRGPPKGPPAAAGTPGTAIGTPPTAAGNPPTAAGTPPTAAGTPPTAVGTPGTAVGTPSNRC